MLDASGLSATAARASPERLTPGQSAVPPVRRTGRCSYPSATHRRGAGPSLHVVSTPGTGDAQSAIRPYAEIS
jgi:hypothetical protein